MIVPARLIEMAKRYEGFYPEPYICPGGYRTIGYGHVIRKDEEFKHPISEEQATQILIEDLKGAVAQALFLSPLLRYEPSDRLTAIADFIFNLGSGRYKASTLRYYVNTKQFQEAARQILRWVYAGGRPLLGLLRRRSEEARLLLDPGGEEVGS
ncbi:MAG: lysozyme [Candidatus Bilamarchaeaceae archaeon]